MQLIPNYNDYSIYYSRIAIIQKEKKKKEKEKMRMINEKKAGIHQSTPPFDRNKSESISGCNTNGEGLGLACESFFQ